MAIDYDTLFEQIGRIIARSNDLGEDAEMLDSDLYDLQEILEAGNLPAISEGLIGKYGSAKNALFSLRAGLAETVAARLRDRETVVDELEIQTDGLQAVLAALIADMGNSSESVESSEVTIGSVTAGGSNVGNGTLLTSGVMDGVTAPARGVTPHPDYAGVACEQVIPETMTLVCNGDSYTDRLTEGTERFSWNGIAPNSNVWDIIRQGSGTGPAIQLANAASIITNRDFETFTSTNTPTGWTLTGTAGTHIFAEGTEVYRGSKSLKFTGTGAQATIAVTQSVAAASLTPRKRYNLSIRIKASATIAAGDLTIMFTGTGYTAATSEKITIAAGSLPTSWTLYNFWITLPAVIPSDFALSISWGSTPTSAKNLYLDSLAFAPATYHNGVGLVGVAGSTRFVRGDSFTVATENTEGLFQQFFRKAFNVQLPSSNTPTISEGWAG